MESLSHSSITNINKLQKLKKKQQLKSVDTMHVFQFICSLVDPQNDSMNAIYNMF